MDVNVKSGIFFVLCLVILHAGLGIAKPRALFYPDPLLVKLGIEVKDIVRHQEKFRKDRTHMEWMGQLHSTISDIDPEKKEALIQMHTSLLYIKERLDSAYLGGQINKQELAGGIGELMQWFQQANRAVLSENEYNLLFGISVQDEAPFSADIPDDEIGFPVPNPETTVKMIKEQFNDRTISDITRFYRQQSQELSDILEIYDSGNFDGATKWQVRKDMTRIENELQAAFMKYCRNRLTGQEFQLLFGNSE
jgi:hypothetical protein